MKVVNLGTIESFIFVSDVHLRHPDDSRTRHFLNFLNELPQVEYLILGGDIFDFILAHKKYFVDFWEVLGEALQKVKQRGIKIAFMEGNHDFGFEHFPHNSWKSLFDWCGDARLSLTHPTLGKILMTHGDNVVCPSRYLLFRYLVKHAWLQCLAFLVPGKILQSLFSRFALLSRRREHYRTFHVGKCLSQISTILEKNPCDVFLMGHIHHALEEKIYQTKVYTTTDWLVFPIWYRVNEKGDVIQEKFGL